MSISLQKGQKVSLSKDNAGLAKVIVGLGWDEVGQSSGGGFFGSLFGSSSSSSSEDIDCDASAIMLRNGKFVDKHDVVYFGNLSHKSGSVNHQGDNLTGAGEGDDEQIIIDLSRVPAEYDKIVMVVNIYDAVPRRQHFGMIKNAFIRLVDARNNAIKNRAIDSDRAHFVYLLNGHSIIVSIQVDDITSVVKVGLLGLLRRTLIAS